MRASLVAQPLSDLRVAQFDHRLGDRVPVVGVDDSAARSDQLGRSPHGCADAGNARGSSLDVGNAGGLDGGGHHETGGAGEERWHVLVRAMPHNAILV